MRLRTGTRPPAKMTPDQLAEAQPWLGNGSRRRRDVRNGGPRGGDRDMEALIAGHGLLIRLLLAQQSRDLECGVPVSNRVGLAELKREDKDELKDTLRRIRSTPDFVRDLMF